MELAPGKLPPEILEKYLLRMTGASSRELVVSPAIGIDFGVIRAGNGYLIVSSDPVTGVEKRVGEYAVNVSANDVATSGNRPRFIQTVILLPEKASVNLVRKISTEIHSSCSRLGIAIVGGHTELTPGLRRPIVVTTVFTFSESFITAAGAREGDSIMMTKTAGVEGTAILAGMLRGSKVERDRTLGRDGEKFFARLSIVREAEAAFATGAVHAMHDCTEGGVLGAVYEMAYASRRGFRVFESKIPVAPETHRICSKFRVDPLRLISSGTLLLSVKPGLEAKVTEKLARIDVKSAVIGQFSGRKRTLVSSSGSEEALLTSGLDEFWRLSAKRGP